MIQFRNYASTSAAIFVAVIASISAAIPNAYGRDGFVGDTPQVTASVPARIAPNPLNNDLGVFGSVAISAAKLPASSKWSNAVAADYSAFFSADCVGAGFSGCNTPFARSVQRARRNGEDLSGTALLRFANRTINAAFPYQTDAQTWGQSDRWVTIPELAAKGAGDCEDYAIAKYWLLRSMGFPAQNLQVVVLADTRRQVYHAILVAHHNGTAYVLDNLSSAVRVDTSLRNYVPIMSFANGKSYIHGFANPNISVTASLSTVDPGVGF